MRTSFVRLTLCALLLALATAPAAMATGPFSLKGTWQAVADADQSQTLFNFHRGGTLTASSSSAAFSAGQGEWKRVGLRDYVARNTAFIYDANGAAEFIVIVDFELEVNGDTFTAVFTSTVTLLDGTVIDVQTGTGSGVRIGLH
ncbi:MAG: hypothetical protein MI919_40555 [Holophagales bacterium]|nr:hypothetical protein [Holophagales bacterium]